MKINKPKFFILLISFLLINSVFARAGVVFTDAGKVLKLGRSVSFFIDSTGNRTFNQVIQDAAFKPCITDVPNFGLTRCPVWLKIEINNRSNNPDLMLEFDEASFDRIVFYYPQGNTFLSSQGGFLYPFSSRLINYHKYIYPVNIALNTSATYYIRINSVQEMQLPILLGQKDTLISREMMKNILFGIYFGIIAVMFFYNLFIYFTVRDNIYLYYVIYILVVGLTQATIEGYSFQYLWPDSVFFAPRAFFIFTALVNITGLEFVRRFLNTGQFLPRITKLFYALYLVYGTAIILTLSGFYYVTYQLLQGFAGLVSIFMLVIAIIIAKKGYRPAKFFFIAWIPLIIGIFIYVLRDLNLIPYNTLSNYSITLGSTIEVILLSFALADRINILKNEKEKLREDAMQAIRENERIIKDQNAMLEIKVTERTFELNNTLEDLKQAQAQLVESEKMASLGQLTAGIAHEINNPINFVTSNVSPLKRDVEQLFEAIDSIESIGLSDSPTAEKQQMIGDYKEELDFDYLKMEISQLLNGIHDGATRTAEIVKGLRIFSRLDEDDLKTANLNEGLDSTLIILNNLLTDKIKVIKQYGQIPLVECYPGKLNQVFLNIISNAIYAVAKKYGDKPGGEIIINTIEENGHVLISIKDNGTGMDEQTQKKVFEPFFTTKDVGEGTGLGMSIAYNTIKKHNGLLTVVSVPGDGTQFTIKLSVRLQLSIAQQNMPGHLA